ncbi:protein kinase domain-containing protein [Streptomyces phytohabitans]|uniref:protein kinase domain-containing protein n=1 Tax=Streptomyces phytohabitans TaxID=1150371 RepID=UPI00345B83D3
MTYSERPRLVADRYLLRDQLGSGGMGTVWRAEDEVLGRTVAVKEVRLRAGGEGPRVQAERAQREARAVARLSHPGVVHVHDLVTEDERLWLVMELIDGPSLAEHLAVQGPMTPPAVAAAGLQLLSALDAVHATGTLHRDVKPANVLLRRDGRVVLCDFGIAALVGTDPLTTYGGVVGSLDYIAPERLGGRPAGTAGDLFSLGGTLCTLLTGRSPFARPEVAAVLHAVAYEEPELPASVGPLREVLEALLRKDPDARPTAAEAAALLRPVAGAAADGPAGPVGAAGSAGADGVTAALPPLPPTARFDAAADAPGTDAPGAAADTGTGAGAAAAGTAGRRGRRRPLLLSALALLLVGGLTAGFLTHRANDDGDTRNDPADAAEGDTAAADSSTRVDAAMPTPDDPNLRAPGTYWLFTGDHYQRVRTAAADRPVRERLTRPAPLDGWSATLGRFPGFRDGVDAVLRVPGHRDEFWVFAGDRYLRMRVAADGYADTLVAGPRPAADWDTAFAGLASTGVDAVMPVPDAPDQVWVFSGDRYVRTELAGDRPGGRALTGASGLDGWPRTLGRVPGFRQGIDEVVPVPGTPDRFWVFAGHRCMKIRVSGADHVDTVVQGPRPLGD